MINECDRGLITGMVLRRRIRLIVGSSMLLILLRPFATSGHDWQGSTQVQISSSELQEDLKRLNSFRSSRDLESLEAVVNRDSAKWQTNRQSFVTYMSGACSLLSSYDLGDESRQALLLSRYAISLLTSGELPLMEEVKFTEFLTRDPLVIDEASWKRVRKQKAQLWLKAWRHVTESIDSKFNFDDRPSLNVQPPPATGLPAGTSPESIKDSKLRAEYEKAIAQNSAKAVTYNYQYWLKQNAPSFYKEAERYLVNAYSRQPVDMPELEQLMSDTIGEEAVRNRIREEIRAREK